MDKERLDLLKKRLVSDEGFNPVAHQVFGKWHIGFGHYLGQEQTDEELEVMGLDDELDDWEGFELTPDQCESLFKIDVEDAFADAQLVFDDNVLDSLTPSRWCVVVEMCYQMGAGGVRKFKSFIAAVIDGDWDRAADEMLWSNGLRRQRRSAWYKQTPDRCQEAADAMRGGSFHGHEVVTDVGAGLMSSEGISKEDIVELIAAKLGVEIEIIYPETS